MTAEPAADQQTPDGWGPARSRTVTWHDPLLTAVGALVAVSARSRGSALAWRALSLRRAPGEGSV